MSRRLESPEAPTLYDNLAISAIREPSSDREQPNFCTGFTDYRMCGFGRSGFQQEMEGCADQGRHNLETIHRQFDEGLTWVQLSKLKATGSQRNMIYKEFQQKQEYKMI
jgi:hypothetical protein